jgi:hypothetical protein
MAGEALDERRVRSFALLVLAVLLPTGACTPPLPPEEPAPPEPNPWLSPALEARRRGHQTDAHDEALLRALAEKRIHPIDGLLLDAAANVEGVELPEDAAVYLRVDPDRTTAVAWHDPTTSEVVEMRTSYRLDVRDPPGIGSRQGPAGESFYTYGFAYYPSWERVLPEPGVELIDAFYTQGVEHVRDTLLRYEAVARPEHSGGDLTTIEWNETVLARMRAWGARFPGAPMFQLPPSGTVDARPERMAQALATGRVVIDEQGVADYLASDDAKNKFGEALPSAEDVKRVVSAPFRQPTRFSDLDRMILLGAIDEGAEPLRIVIDPKIAPGFFVPDTGEKVILMSPSEVTLNFGYNGLVFAKLAHEALHVVTFRARRFLAERCWPEEDDMLETMNYLMEFMWWVQSYPNDAPAWDWEPINSGLVLAHLLNAYYPNNRC